jgi:hypothetical protein
MILTASFNDPNLKENINLANQNNFYNVKQYVTIVLHQATNEEDNHSPTMEPRSASQILNTTVLNPHSTRLLIHQTFPTSTKEKDQNLLVCAKQASAFLIQERLWGVNLLTLLLVK